MGFFDDVKEDQTLQIQVLCVAFFLIAFPSYFMIKASATENPTGMGGVGSYTVTADFTYIDFASGEEPIQDGSPFTLDLNTDLLDDVDGKNIVGVLVTMSYGEDESEDSLDPFGVGCATGGLSPDTITGTASHLNYSNSADGQNQGGSSSHEVSTVWYNSSVIGDKIEGLSESQIIDELSKGIGLGDYSIEISVAAQDGSTATCSREDTGENVTYTVQLIVLDYSITSYVEVEDI